MFLWSLLLFAPCSRAFKLTEESAIRVSCPDSNLNPSPSQNWDVQDAAASESSLSLSCDYDLNHVKTLADLEPGLAGWTRTPWMVAANCQGSAAFKLPVGSSAVGRLPGRQRAGDSQAHNVVKVISKK